MRKKESENFTDRLLGQKNITSPIKTNDQKMYELSEAIRSNIELLLNTKKRVIPSDKNFNYIEQSVLNYGLEDFMGIYFDSKLVCEELCVKIENAINSFESRLKNVRVLLDENYTLQNKNVAFHIEGTLQIEQEYQPVNYHSQFIQPSRLFAVSTLNRGG